MKKEDLLKLITDCAYNVGFGAKKHFATYDIVEKAPGLIAFASMAVGIFGLVFDCLSAKALSAFFLVLGIASFYIERYSECKEEYAKKGEALTLLYNELKTLYLQVKSSCNSSFDTEYVEFEKISAKYYENCISKQIMFSDWFAHYKFFWQHQIDWVDEQKHFKLWRDKMPLSFVICVLVFLLCVIGYGICICAKSR